jgi:hypothetical protein
LDDGTLSPQPLENPPEVSSQQDLNWKWDHQEFDLSEFKARAQNVAM